MTSEEFWKDDPKLFSSYQKAYIEKTKRENEKINYSNWLQGLYNYDGFQVSLNDLAMSFSKNKSGERPTYPDKPYDLFGKNKKDVVDKKAIARKKNQQNLNYWATIKK